MLRWHVERPGRAAARPVHPPTGRSPRRLPSLQTPASRTGLGCDRAGVRLGLRTLVLAGFATAAWLLSASAAQAAEEPAVDPFPASVGAVTAAVQPVPGLAPTLLSDAASSSTEATSAAPSSGPVGPPASSGVLATRPGVVAVPAAGGDTGVREAAGLLRRFVAPLHTVVDSHPLPPLTRAVAGSLDGVLRPVTDAPHHAADAVTAALTPAAGPAPGNPAGPGGGAGTRPGPRAVPAPAPATARVPAAARTGTRAVPAATPATVLVGDDRVPTVAGIRPGVSASGQPGSATGRSRTGTAPGGAGAPVLRPASHHAPAQPPRAPMSGQLGVAAGSSASASGCGTTGGPLAVAPDPVAAGAAPGRRVAARTAFAVPRQDAEHPSVSPD